MNKWMEDTFEHGWSHGSTGDKLKSKKLIASFTAGATWGSLSERRNNGLYN